jgi:hypothetical protein
MLLTDTQHHNQLKWNIEFSNNNEAEKFDDQLPFNGVIDCLTLPV